MGVKILRNEALNIEKKHVGKSREIKNTINAHSGSAFCCFLFWLEDL